MSHYPARSRPAPIDPLKRPLNLCPRNTRSWSRTLAHIIANYSRFDESEKVYSAEMLNLKFENDYYNRKKVDALEVALEHPKNGYSSIFIGIDPSGGGPSDLAFVVIGTPYKREGKRRILAISLYSCTSHLNEVTEKATRQLFDHVSENYGKGSKIYVACENEPKGSMEFIFSIAKDYKNFYILSDRKWRETTLGMPAHPLGKANIMYSLGQSVSNDNFGFLRNCEGFSNKYRITREEGTMGRCMVNVIKTELNNMGIVIKGSREVVSGKRNGCQDDGVMALAHGLYAEHIFHVPNRSSMLAIEQIG